MEKILLGIISPKVCCFPQIARPADPSCSFTQDCNARNFFTSIRRHCFSKETFTFQHKKLDSRCFIDRMEADMAGLIAIVQYRPRTPRGFFDVDGGCMCPGYFSFIQWLSMDFFVGTCYKRISGVGGRGRHDCRPLHTRHGRMKPWPRRALEDPASSRAFFLRHAVMKETPVGIF